MKDEETRYIVLLYKTDKFEGIVTSSEEGDVDGSCVVKKHYTITLMHNFSISKTSICPAKSNITHVIKKLSLR